jgi:hypothetical protein
LKNFVNLIKNRDKKDEDLVKLFQRIKLETLDKYKMENQVLKKQNKFECHREVQDKFSNFEFKYYSKLFILHQNEDLCKNFEFKKYLELNKNKQISCDSSLFLRLKTYYPFILNKIKNLFLSKN